jgi:PPOX class probable F420-dependent enzyme
VPADVTLQPWELGLVSELRVARLGTIASAGAPHLGPVCYAFVDGRFAIAVDEKPKASTELARLRNIARDPRATLLLDRYDDDWTRLAWVRIEGSATVFETGNEWPAALAALRTRYHQYQTMSLESLPLIRIQPERVVSWHWQ